MRIDLTQEQFDKATFLKIKQLTPKTYKAVCTCPRCGGTGFVRFSSLDNSRCWQCEETGKVVATIRIVKHSSVLSPEEVEANIKARREKNRNHWLELGFKKVDFKLADWTWKVCEAWFNEGDYYRIVKETEKAYLMEQVCNIEDSQASSSYWIPKKAITWEA